jgi:hypothetical protein
MYEALATPRTFDAPGEATDASTLNERYRYCATGTRARSSSNQLSTMWNCADVGPALDAVAPGEVRARNFPLGVTSYELREFGAVKRNGLATGTALPNPTDGAVMKRTASNPPKRGT